MGALNSGSEPSVPRSRAVWLYLLVLVPLATELIEGGGLSRTLRASITELVMTALLALAVAVINRQSRRLAQAAMTDPLTGLGNRRALSRSLRRELTRAERLDHSLSLIFIDLDRFKAINDQLGHQVGDRTLQSTAEVLVREARHDVDSCYRVGGDEFVVLCPGADARAAGDIAQRIRRRAAPLFHAIGVDGAGLSVGLSQRRDRDRGEDLLRRADVDMYRDKGAREGLRRRRAAPVLLPPHRVGATSELV